MLQLKIPSPQCHQYEASLPMLKEVQQELGMCSYVGGVMRKANSPPKNQAVNRRSKSFKKLPYLKRT